MNKIIQSKKILAASFGSKKVVFNTVTYKPYILNSTAACIWNFCRSPKSIMGITKYLSRRYAIRMPAAKRDVISFMKNLKKNKLVEIYE